MSARWEDTLPSEASGELSLAAGRMSGDAQQAAEGLSVLMVSSDLPEVLSLADRIIVMKEGRIEGELAGADVTEEAVMHLATHEAVA